VFLLLVRVTVCAASFSLWCAKAAPRWGSNESSSVESPSKTSQPPCQQQLASHSRLNQERKTLARIKGPDSARPRLRVQNARRIRFDSASCMMFQFLHLALPPSASCIAGETQIGPQKACADTRCSFPRLICLAPQLVTGGALVEFSTVAASR